MSGIPVCLTFRKVFIASLVGVGVFLIPNGVLSAVNNFATLQWTANQESDLGGYTVYHGTSPGIYSESQDTGKTVTIQYASLESNQTHDFTVTAYDESGNESLPSSEVHKTIIAPDSVLSVSVTGDGTVRSSPVGLSCSSGTCSGRFTQGSTVTLTATPGIGKTFGGWNGSCTGTGVCVVPVSTSPASVSVTFAVSLEEEQRLAAAAAEKLKEEERLAAEAVSSKEQLELAKVEYLKQRESLAKTKTQLEFAKAEYRKRRELAEVEYRKQGELLAKA